MCGVEKTMFNSHLVVSATGAGWGGESPRLGPCRCQFLLDSSAVLVVSVE